GSDRPTVGWTPPPHEDEVGASLSRSGIVYEHRIRNDQADNVIEIGIIVDATDPPWIRRAGVGEHGQATEENAEQERQRGRPYAAAAHTHLPTPEAECVPHP